MSTETGPLTAGSLDELVAGATDRVEVRSSDAKSGSRFETLRIDGVPHFLKTLSAEDDWIMRVTGNDSNWEYKVWRAGLYAETPTVIDHTVVGMALEGTGPSARLSILMSDCGADLVPPGDDVVPAPHHADWIDHMAQMHAHFLGWHDDLGLQDLSRRWMFFAPETIAPELEAADVPGPIAVAHQGWGLLPERAPRLHDLVRGVHRDPAGLSVALRATPADLRRRRLEVRQRRPPTGRPDHPDRLGLPGRGSAVLGPGLVPRAQPGPTPGEQGGDDRPLPRAARGARGRHHRRGGTASSD